MAQVAARRQRGERVGAGGEAAGGWPRRGASVEGCQAAAPRRRRRAATTRGWRGVWVGPRARAAARGRRGCAVDPSPGTLFRPDVDANTCKSVFGPTSGPRGTSSDRGRNRGCARSWFPIAAQKCRSMLEKHVPTRDRRGTVPQCHTARSKCVARFHRVHFLIARPSIAPLGCCAVALVRTKKWFHPTGGPL